MSLLNCRCQAIDPAGESAFDLTQVAFLCVPTRGSMIQWQSRTIPVESAPPTCFNITYTPSRLTGGHSELNQAILALEDGTVFEGKSFGAHKDSIGEVVFNTSITGYQEIFTDPSYSGQIVVLTNPQIGNYGANHEDLEAPRPYIEGLIVREFSSIASNWRSDENAEKFLSDNNVPVAAEIDTRALVRHLRTRGVMRGVLAASGGDRTELIERARKSPSMAGLDLATRVSTPKTYTWDQPVEPCSPS